MSESTTAATARQQYVIRQLRDWLRREELTAEAKALRTRQRIVNARTRRVLALCRAGRQGGAA